MMRDSDTTYTELMFKQGEFDCDFCCFNATITFRPNKWHLHVVVDLGYDWLSRLIRT